MYNFVNTRQVRVLAFLQCIAYGQNAPSCDPLSIIGQAIRAPDWYYIKAKATTDPNTKSQSCVHDCSPNPNPNPKAKPLP